MTGRRLVRAITVTGVGALAEQYPSAPCQQEMDVYHDPAACTSNRVLPHCDRLVARPPQPEPMPCAPAPVCLDFGCTAQEREPYRRRVVERHVHKPPEPVDDRCY